MKTTIASLLALAAASVAVAQGTLEFTVMMRGAHALPPNTSTFQGEGSFSLSPTSAFGGLLSVQGATAQGSVIVYSSASSGVLGTSVFTLSPGDFWPPFLDENGQGDPGGRHFSTQRTLTQAERADLLAGNWWAVYSVPGSPSSDLRGQITIVPEPSTWALLATGGSVLWWCGRRKRMG